MYTGFERLICSPCNSSGLNVDTLGSPSCTNQGVEGDMRGLHSPDLVAMRLRQIFRHDIQTPLTGCSSSPGRQSLSVSSPVCR